MPNPYIHDPNILYPNVDCEHMIKFPKVHNYIYDKDFPYRLNSSKQKFIKFLMKIVMLLIVKPVCFIRYALIIKGKKNIRLYRKISKSKAMISVSNHTTEWDILFVELTRYFRFAEFPCWIEGVESKSGMLYRMAGGIALPRFSRHGMAYAYNAMKEVVDEGKWIHIFPEASCWAFYPAVREFQHGSFRLAYDTHMPILPMGVSYRKPRGIYKLFKKHPNAKIVIGKPLLVNYELDKKDAIEDLAIRAQREVMNLIGIKDSKENNKIRELVNYKNKSFDI